MAPLAIFRTPLARSPDGLSYKDPDAGLAAHPKPLLKGHPVQPIEPCRLSNFGVTP